MAKPFQPAYVTETERLDGTSETTELFDYETAAARARDRLLQYMARHADYAGRDRDLLLLRLMDATERLDDKLAAIKRTLDVLVVRIR
jgi:hypothetical protein